jgi:hypothetical protein
VPDFVFSFYGNEYTGPRIDGVAGEALVYLSDRRTWSYCHAWGASEGLENYLGFNGPDTPTSDEIVAAIHKEVRRRGRQVLACWNGK